MPDCYKNNIFTVEAFHFQMKTIGLSNIIISFRSTVRIYRVIFRISFESRMYYSYMAFKIMPQNGFTISKKVL